MNGYAAEARFRSEDLDDVAVAWIIAEAKRCYPRSKFAREF